MTHPLLTLTCEDCMDLMRRYPDKHFDLAIVDPPYGLKIGKNKAGMGRRRGDAKAQYQMGDWDHSPPSAEYFTELFRVSKNQVIWGANHFIQLIPYPSPCWIVWDKKYSNDVSFAAVELAWTSFRSTAKKHTEFPQHGGRIHPTQKPIALYSFILSTYALPTWKILDTHLGSGSIALAAINAGLHLTACEIDAGYFARVVERINAKLNSP